MSAIKSTSPLRKTGSFLANNLVAVLFLILTIISIPVSGFSATYIVNEILSRIARNSFLVFSLILPIMAGMGINFGMVLGAMAGQIGLIFAMDWGISGIQGLVFASLIGTPISIFLGWIAGFGGRASILFPQSVVDEYHDLCRAALEA